MPPCVTGRRSARRRTVTSVVSRIGIASTSSGRSVDRRNGRPGGRPARREPERGEHEAEHLAAPVAHEDVGAAAGAEVEREEAETREREREREDEHEVVLVHRRRVYREVEARHGRERRREAVHVVQQVERVRDPHEPESATMTPRTSFVTSSTRRPAAIAIPAAPNWTASLDSGLRWRTSSITRDEQDPGSGEDARELPGRIDGADGDRERRPCGEAGGDSHAAEGQHQAVVQRSPVGTTTSRRATVGDHHRPSPAAARPPPPGLRR